MLKIIGGLRAVLGVVVSCFALAVQATPITLTGDSISYVYDDSQAALSLYGAPTIVGDVVRFAPGTYGASSLNGSGAVQRLSEFVFSSIYSHSGAEITNIEVLAYGDYKIINGDEVHADLRLSAGSNVAAETAAAGNVFGSSGAAGRQIWTLSAALNPADLLSADANDVNLSLKPLLTAMTDANAEAAQIYVKLLLIKVTADGAIIGPRAPDVGTVPTPSTVALLGGALLAAGLVSRKKLGGCSQKNLSGR